jgi:nucleoside-diphosphate-sugar epimerase
LLVTGSSGFLGSHVAEHLAANPQFQVRGFDLQRAESRSVPTTCGDLCDRNAIEAACRGVDIVLHFGGIGDVDLATMDPTLAVRANVEGTTNVALAALQARARVIYASSWEVYGEPIYQPIDEDHPCVPGHFYGATKLAGEQMLHAASVSASLPVVVLRLGTAFGRGMRPNTVFRRFIARGMASQPLIVNGSGEQWRQFTHTSDICRAVSLVCSSRPQDAIVNITSEERVSILELAETIASAYGVSITFAPSRHDDPPPSLISSDRARRLLGWKAEVPFARGLAELLNGQGALEPEHL